MKYNLRINKSTSSMIQSKILNLPEETTHRLEILSQLVDSEMTRQKAYYYNADVDADEFNTIGREIAMAIKIFLGNEYHVEYVPIEPSGRVRTDKAEIIA